MIWCIFWAGTGHNPSHLRTPAYMQTVLDFDGKRLLYLEAAVTLRREGQREGHVGKKGHTRI